MAKLSQKDYEYRRTENSVSSINYHFVFVPKRRKPVLVKDVAKRLQEIIFELVTEHGWKLSTWTKLITQNSLRMKRSGMTQSQYFEIASLCSL